MNVKLLGPWVALPLIGMTVLAGGCTTEAVEAAPCMTVLDRFSAPDVPVVGLAGEPVPYGDPNAVMPPGLPPKLMVVNIKTGAVEVNHELPYIQPPDLNRIHGQFRRARVTAQGTYTLTDLGPLPQVPDDVAMRINNKGQVSLWVPATSVSVNAGVWTGAKIQRLGRVAGYPTSLARAVNAGGQVAGWVSTSLNPVDSEATVRAVVFSHGVPRVLGTLGGRNSQAFGVNAQGQIVGVADLADGHRHAFVEDGKKMTDMGTLPDGVFSQAFAINSAGNVVGMADSKGDRHAVEWRQGRIHDLGTLPGGGSSCAVAINDKDQVVGYSASSDGYHAFLYANGTMQDLGTLKEDPSSANDINIHGDVVGVASIGNLERHAFLWHDGHLYDLNALTPSARASGWELVSADAINDRGQIACVGIQKNGLPHAVLLTPAVSPISSDLISRGQR